MRNLSLAVILVCAPLVSCSTAAQVEGSRASNVYKETVAALKACTENVTANENYSQILKKVYVSASDNNPPLEMLTDKSYPTKIQIEKLYKLHDDMHECRNIVIDGASKVSPVFYSWANDLYVEKDKWWTALVGSKLSFGEFNIGLRDVTSKGNAQLNQLRQQYALQLDSQHQKEIAQRVQAAEALQQAGATMQQTAYQQQVLANQQAAINAASSAD